MKFAWAIVALCVCPAAEGLVAGAAKAEITPVIGTPLNGDIEREGRGATAIHDPLWVRCLYLEDESTAFFLLSADLYAITPALREAVLDVSPLDFPADHIVLTATGTHNGPGGMDRSLPKRLVSGRYMPGLVEETARSFASAMREAYDQRRRGTIGYATSTQSVLTRNATVDGGPIDEQIAVIRVDDADGIPIAILANFAANPNVAHGAFPYSFSADYPGVFCDALEELASQGCIAMLLTGAAGDQEIVDPNGSAGWAAAESVGNLLAVRVKSLANTIDGNEARLGLRTVTAPTPPVLVSGSVPQETRIQVLEIGRLAISLVPAMPYAEIGIGLSALAQDGRYAAHMTVALANGRLGYLANAERFATATGTRSAAQLGPGADAWAYEHLAPLLGAKTSPPKQAVYHEEDFNGLRWIRVEGDAISRGIRRGAASRETLVAAVDRFVLAPPRRSERSPWKIAPGFVNQRPVVLAERAAMARHRLLGVAPGVIEELLGMAQGSELPFDALWMLETALAIGDTPTKPTLVEATVVGGTGMVGAVWALPKDSDVRVVETVDTTEGRSVAIEFGPGMTMVAGTKAGFSAVLLPQGGAPLSEAELAPATTVLRNLLATANGVVEAENALGSSGLRFDREVLMAGSTSAHFLEPMSARAIAIPGSGYSLRGKSFSITEDGTDPTEALKKHLHEAVRAHVIAGGDAPRFLAAIMDGTTVSIAGFNTNADTIDYRPVDLRAPAQ